MKRIRDRDIQKFTEGEDGSYVGCVENGATDLVVCNGKDEPMILALEGDDVDKIIEGLQGLKKA